MSILQLWLFVGIPVLALATALFVGRSAWRSLLGYAVLLVGFVVMVFFDRASAAIFGTVIALLYASGRGGEKEREYDLMTHTGVGAAEAAETGEPGSQTPAGAASS
jgi:Na+/H+ antiporter NhaC